MDVMCDRCGYRVAVPSRAGTRCNQGDRTAPNGYCPGTMRLVPEAAAIAEKRSKGGPRAEARGSAESLAKGVTPTPGPPSPDLPFPTPPRESKSGSPEPPQTPPKRSGR